MRPLLGQLDPATAQLTPAVDFIGQYKPELTSFFANAAAATQAKEPVGDEQVHYLRTSNPLNAENLAVYPNRLPTNRPEPVPAAGWLQRDRPGPAGLREPPVQRGQPAADADNTPIDLVNDGRDRGADGGGFRGAVAGRGLIPPVTLPPIPQIPMTPEQAEALIPDELLALIQQYAFGGPRVPARRAAVPQAGQYTTGGDTRSTRTSRRAPADSAPRRRTAAPCGRLAAPGRPPATPQVRQWSRLAACGTRCSRNAGEPPARTLAWRGWWAWRRGVPGGCWRSRGAGGARRARRVAAAGERGDVDAGRVGVGSGRATAVAHARFGDEAVYVLVREDLPRLVLTSDLNRMLGLEGCLSGNLPDGGDAAGRGWRAVRAAGALQAGAGRLRAGDVHQLVGRGADEAAAGPDAGAGGAGRSGARRGA